jgi:polyisoprenoid-binding protein YceI
MPNHRAVLALTAALLMPFAGVVSAAEWRIDPAASRLTFIGTQAGRPFEGLFEKFTANVRFDESDLGASKVVAVIDMASAKTGNAQGDAAIKGQDWFAVDTYPKAQFETKSFRHVGGNRYEANAVLTIRDVAKPVVLPFALTKVGDATRASGDLVINRTDYGVGQGQWASPQSVAHEVTIRFDLLAKPAR